MTAEQRSGTVTILFTDLVCSTELTQRLGDDQAEELRHVILASRIAGKARGGEILVSSLLTEHTESGGDIRFREAREVDLKGPAGSHRVHEVIWKAANEGGS